MTDPITFKNKAGVAATLDAAYDTCRLLNVASAASIIDQVAKMLQQAAGQTSWPPILTMTCQLVRCH
jgi:hypothetical protein